MSRTFQPWPQPIAPQMVRQSPRASDVLFFGWPASRQFRRVDPAPAYLAVPAGIAIPGAARDRWAPSPIPQILEVASPARPMVDVPAVSNLWRVPIAPPADTTRYYARLQGLGSDLSTGLFTAGGVLTSIAPATGPLAAPFVAAAGQIVTLAGQIAQMFSGCGQTCVETSQAADQAEVLIKQMLATYQNLPVHYVSLQQQYLTSFDQIAAKLNQICSNPQMGDAGRRCISERLVRGGTAPWCPKPGHTGCDWITAYRDPVANDPTVQPDPSFLQDLIGGSSGASWLPLGLALLVVLGVILL